MMRSVLASSFRGVSSSSHYGGGEIRANYGSSQPDPPTCRLLQGIYAEVKKRRNLVGASYKRACQLLCCGIFPQGFFCNLGERPPSPQAHSSIEELLPPGRAPAGVAQQCHLSPVSPTPPVSSAPSSSLALVILAPLVSLVPLSPLSPLSLPRPLSPFSPMSTV